MYTLFRRPRLPPHVRTSSALKWWIDVCALDKKIHVSRYCATPAVLPHFQPLFSRRAYTLAIDLQGFYVRETTTKTSWRDNRRIPPSKSTHEDRTRKFF